MEPTLLIGDYLFVSKFSYGYSRYSFPIDLSFIHGRIWEGEPKRGDIVVFRPPREPGHGLHQARDRLSRRQDPGAAAASSTSTAKPVPREPAGDWEGEGPFDDRPDPQYRETLPNGVSYITLDKNPNGPGDNTQVFEVPPGHYFFMGDNRDNSQDSRFLEGPVGFVPAENLVGRAEIIFFSVDGAPAWAFWKWPTSLRLDRIFETL